MLKVLKELTHLAESVVILEQVHHLAGVSLGLGLVMIMAMTMVMVEIMVIVIITQRSHHFIYFIHFGH